MQLVIGAVTSVKGTAVRALINPNLYQTTYIYDGKLYRGVSINEYIVIKKGFHEIVGKIEGEEIIEKNLTTKNSPMQISMIDLLTLKLLDTCKITSFNLV